MSTVDAVSDEANLKLDYKRKSFDKEVRALITQSQETIQSRYGVSMELGDQRTEAICLNRYLTIYNNMTPQEHFEYFEALYNRNRVAILNCLKDDRWIRTGKLVVQFGEGRKGMEERCRQMCIMISDIFLIACDLQDKAEKALQGLEGELASSVGGKDLIRPNILLLHLMRIFYHLNDGDDKEKLGEIVTSLENLLGSPVKTVGSEPWKTAVVAAPTEGGSGGLSGLFTMATNMMEKLGYQPPPGMKPPTEGEISSVLSTVFNNKTAQTAMQGMFSQIQGCQDFGSAVSTVMQNVADPATMSAIQDSVISTVQAAAPVEKPN